MCRLIVVAIALIAVPAVGDELTDRAARALGERAPAPFERVSPITMRRLLWLPTQSRAGKLSRGAIERAENSLLLLMCGRHDFAPPEGAKPVLFAGKVDVDFAAIRDGLAMLTFQAVLKASEGMPAEEITPVAMQLGDNAVVLLSHRGAVLDRQIALAIELDPLAKNIVLFFVHSKTHSPIPSEWLSVKGEKLGVYIYPIDRPALIAAQPEKAQADKRAAEEAAKRQAEEQRAARIAAMNLLDWRTKDGSKRVRGEFVKYERGGLTIITDELKSETFRFADLDEKSREQLRDILRQKREAERKHSNRRGTQ
ncbi:MAG TPA: hypothetical protein VF175_05200 [Lacipirellula sp.]